jgi:uncharacterized protein (DUF433 family)
MTNYSKLVVVDPDIMSGEPVFAGTRVPVRTFLDHLKAGDDLDVFLDDFPSVSRDQAVSYLAEASEHLLAEVSDARH